MSYFINYEEFKILMDHVKPGALFSDIEEERRPIDGRSVFVWKSKATNEVRFRITGLSGGDSTYEAVTELLPEETKEPTPRLHLKVETLEELQEIINACEKLRKEQENGNQR